MGLRITVFLGSHLDLYHTSRFLTGLCALQSHGAIGLRYVVPRGDDRWLAADPVVVCLDVEGQRPRRVAVDLRDGLGVSQPIIDRVDCYLKRAYSSAEVAALPPAFADKIDKFGLNYGCRSTASTLRLVRALGWELARRGTRELARVRQYLSTPGASAFEQPPDAPVEPAVVFQTRLWTAAEVPAEEVEPLNSGRVAMVRALRKAFGNRFVGGLVPTPFALAHYPDEITPHPSRYVDYLSLKKRHLISIYTRGVEHSLAFKLGETLAASQCLVSVPLRYELPRPLVAGEHFLSFETPDEAVAACEQLLANHALATEMRHANHSYYVDQVEPAAHVANVIDRISRD